MSQPRILRIVNRALSNKSPSPVVQSNLSWVRLHFLHPHPILTTLHSLCPHPRMNSQPRNHAGASYSSRGKPPRKATAKTASSPPSSPPNNAPITPPQECDHKPCICNLAHPQSFPTLHQPPIIPPHSPAPAFRLSDARKMTPHAGE